MEHRGNPGLLLKVIVLELISTHLFVGADYRPWPSQTVEKEGIGWYSRGVSIADK